MRLRKRLVLARRGHKLLQDKLEEMMRRFLSLLKDINGAKEDFKLRTQKILRDLFYCRMTSSRQDFLATLAKINTQAALSVSSERIMNVKVPAFQLEGLTINKDYDFFKTSGQLDLVLGSAEGYLRSTLKLAQLLKSAEILSAEIERTRRRVNALEYLLIPSISETIRYITQKLNELERGNLVRLMRIKEIIRAH